MYRRERGTTLRKSYPPNEKEIIHGSSQNANTKPKVYFQREQSEPEKSPRGVTVSTLASESSDRGSNPREVCARFEK